MSSFEHGGLTFSPYQISGHIRKNFVEPMRKVIEKEERPLMMIASPGFMDLMKFHNAVGKMQPTKESNRIMGLLRSDDPRQMKRGHRLALQWLEKQNLALESASRRKGLDD